MTVVTAGVLGVLVGRGLRALLWRMRRGARAGPGVCEAGVATAVALPVAATATGVLDAAWVALLAGVGILAVAVAVTDLAHRRIPNPLTVTAAPLLVAAAVPLGARAVLAGLLGGALALVVHAAVHLAAPRSLGGGDVKLAAVLGVPLGATSWWALAVAPVLAAVLVVVAAAVTRQRSVPLGPLLAGVTCALVGVAALRGGTDVEAWRACCGG